jgi:hypothetical protein
MALALAGTILGGVGTIVSVATLARVLARERPNVDIDVGSIFHVLDEDEKSEFALVELHALNTSDAPNVLNWYVIIIASPFQFSSGPVSHAEKDNDLTLYPSIPTERSLTMPRPPAEITWLDPPENLPPRTGVHGFVAFPMPSIPYAAVPDLDIQLEVQFGQGDPVRLAVPKPRLDSGIVKFADPNHAPD